MILFHVVNFIGICVLYLVRVLYYKSAPPRPDQDMLVYGTKKILLMTLICYTTYMTLVLFYLVYRFGRNRQLGQNVYEESLTESEQADEERLSMK